jgi:hypothetical protein
MIGPTTEMQNTRDWVNSQVKEPSFTDVDYIINRQDVDNAIHKLKAHKNDGDLGLSTDHFCTWWHRFVYVYCFYFYEHNSAWLCAK